MAGNGSRLKSSLVPNHRGNQCVLTAPHTAMRANLLPGHSRDGASPHGGSNFSCQTDAGVATIQWRSGRSMPAQVVSRAAQASTGLLQDKPLKHRARPVRQTPPHLQGAQL